MGRLTIFFWMGLMTLFMFQCTPEGVINKTKYEGQKVINTCDNFKREVQALSEANSGASILRRAEYDNSDFGPNFLEPGQFEIRGDTLYFRLIKDLEYEKYLHKGVAIHVLAEYQALDHLSGLEKEPMGSLGTLIIDRAYYDANKNPYFLYKIPVGHKLDGKQIRLRFAVVQYDKKGKVKKVFCNSLEQPIGVIEPSCCTYEPWDPVRLKSVIDLPTLPISPVTYRIKDMTGTIDLIFPMNSIKFDRQKLNDVIFTYVSKYEEEGYQLKSIDMKGYASQGGTVEYNLDLSRRRCEAVYLDLKRHMAKLGKDTTNFPITYEGRGEDWERFEHLSKTEVFTPEERSKLLEIARSPIHPDEKEKQLRQLPFWNKLVDEVLVYCRHTFIKFNLSYNGPDLAFGSFPQLLPIIDPNLYAATLQKKTIGPYQPGSNINENMSVINTLLSTKENANLYAMRSTYHFANGNLKAALADIEKAQKLDPNNSQFAMASIAYRAYLADEYALEERMNLLNQMNDLISRYPQNAQLYYQKVVLQDKIGFISGALAEYDQMITDNTKEAALFNNRGVALMKTNRLQEAEKDFEKAIQLNPNLAEPYFNLAALYAYKGLVRKSANAMQEAIKRNPKFKAEIWTNPVFETVRDMPAFSEFK
jgi:tetratricopeptide (TPR) repeat protein